MLLALTVPAADTLAHTDGVGDTHPLPLSDAVAQPELVDDATPDALSD